MSRLALTGAEIFDGRKRHQNCALLVDGSQITGISPSADVPHDYQQIVLKGGVLAAGFIDAQVNGGGGLLLNEKPDVNTIKTICAAHVPFGTTALLPTLITATSETTALAIKAGIEAVAMKVPGFVGLHLEGPHLSVKKCGAHDASLIRPMTDGDMEMYLAARKALPVLMMTVAPENISTAQIRILAEAGVIVSIGHSNIDADEFRKASAAGASGVTHLFNAMSPLLAREPGIVGAALDDGSVHAGLIADGVHVNPTAISVALRAKKGPGRIFLVTDSMATIGTEIKSFELNGRTIIRQDGRLTLENGTLAGADLDMISAVKFMVQSVGTSVDEALRMASLYPAECLGIADHTGCLKPGYMSDIVHLDTDLGIRNVWVRGVQVFGGNRRS